MKICLITPPSSFLLDERVFVSLGILQVGAYLKQQGHEVHHLDLSGVTNYLEVVEQYEGAKVFGITATSPQMPAAVRIAKVLDSKYGEFCRVILGGPHVTLANAAYKREVKNGIEDGRALWEMGILRLRFDTLVCGDGQYAILQAIQGGHPLIDADDPKSPLWIGNKDFEELPWPDRSLVDVSSYHYHIDGERALSMISQLGCPFGCAFCAGRDSSMLRRIRTRSADNVVAELLHLNEAYGVKGCMFLDDELNVNRGMVDLMWKIKAAGDYHGINWKLRGFIKSELFTEEQAAAMYAAGFRQLLVGFEAGHPRILENIQKQATIEDNTRCMAIAKKHGLKVKALMSIGHPGESYETTKALEEWLLQVRPDDFDVTIITPYPGSPYYDRSIRSGDKWAYRSASGDVLYSEDVDFNADPRFYKGTPGEYKSYVSTDGLTSEQLVSERDRIEEFVRNKLGIPFYATGSAIQYEHSMGQTGIPSHILRRTCNG